MADPFRALYESGKEDLNAKNQGFGDFVASTSTDGPNPPINIPSAEEEDFFNPRPTGMPTTGLTLLTPQRSSTAVLAQPKIPSNNNNNYNNNNNNNVQPKLQPNYDALRTGPAATPYNRPYVVYPQAGPSYPAYGNPQLGAAYPTGYPMAGNNINMMRMGNPAVNMGNVNHGYPSSPSFFPATPSTSNAQTDLFNPRSATSQSATPDLFGSFSNSNSAPSSSNASSNTPFVIDPYDLSALKEATPSAPASKSSSAPSSTSFAPSSAPSSAPSKGPRPPSPQISPRGGNKDSFPNFNHNNNNVSPPKAAPVRNTQQNTSFNSPSFNNTSSGQSADGKFVLKISGVNARAKEPKGKSTTTRMSNVRGSKFS
eukprot:TRINITY_DN3242_c0_g2_i1.p1 TRINITY_DN3242_c0_g2~~TRINITY_DN3242_c0_g2_i1.p1  ORF type:complete len:369 (+),score=104.21 TRINITY_DN3242_c0_g2_i1:59-1165(+)